METPAITDPEFLALDREHQNEALDPYVHGDRLIPALAAAVDALAWNPDERRYRELWLGLGALALFQDRIDPNLLKPHVRVFLGLLERYRNEVPDPDPEWVEHPEEIWDGLGVERPSGDPEYLHWLRTLPEAIVLDAGPRDWEEAYGYVLALRRLSHQLETEPLEQLAALAGAIVLNSRPNRKAIELWHDTWNRTSFQASDLFYHDSRLRRAILDRNLPHAYRLIAVLAKAGRKASDLAAAVIRSSYDLDFADERVALGMFVGAAGLLESSPSLSPDHFRVGIAKLVWDLAYEEKQPHERIFYDEISLIKSREIILDFRKAMLRSDFLQAWGYAEYAFVHGIDPLELLDELIRLSPSFYRGGPELLWFWGHLLATETLVRLLPEEYGIYILAHTVRLASRTPKDPDLLDPFPDEE